MAANITYTKTIRGGRAFVNGLPDAVGQVLTVMDGDLTEGEILARLHDVSEKAFKDAMTWLLEGGFIKLTHSEAFSFSQPNIPLDEAIQVHEISIDEFDALTNTITNEERKRGETVTEKEKARLQAIEITKQIAAAKAEEIAKLNTETEAQKKAEVIAKKEQWAQLKTEAENRAIAEKKVEAEIKARAKAQAEAQEKEKNEAEAKEWAQLKAEAKMKAEEEAKLKVIAKTEEEIKQQRLANKVRSKSHIKQWAIQLLRIIKSLFIFSFVVLFFLIAAVHFINTPMLVTAVEKIASEEIQDKVHIQSAYIWLFPKPHLLLKNILITDDANIQTSIVAEKIRIYPNLIKAKDKLVAALTTPNHAPYEVQSIQVEGLSIAQKDFSHVHTWGKSIVNNQQYVLHHLNFENLSLQVPGLSLPSLFGDVSLNGTDTFKQVTMHTQNKDLSLTINAANGDYLINMNAVNWRAPFSPFPVFAQLNATGIIKNDDLTFSSIVGQLYGGHLTAKLQTNLASPQLTSKGRFKLNEMSINELANDLKLNAAVTGTLNNHGSFSFAVNPSTKTITSLGLDTAFHVENGVVRKVDIAEAMRTKNINGSTNFTKLTGSLSLKNNRYQFTNLFLQDNQLQAYGQVNISADQQVFAAISSTIAIQDNPINTDLIIEGPITALKLID